jgi:hypothetical protein
MTRNGFVGVDLVEEGEVVDLVEVSVSIAADYVSGLIVAIDV